MALYVHFIKHVMFTSSNLLIINSRKFDYCYLLFGISQGQMYDFCHVIYSLYHNYFKITIRSVYTICSFDITGWLYGAGDRSLFGC